MPSALIAGPYSMHPLLGGTRHAQLPTGVLLRAGLSPAVKVLDLKERLRYRRCGRKWRAVVSVKWWGQGQRAAPRPRGWTPSLCVRKNGRALPVKTRLAGLYGGPGTESLLTLCWRKRDSNIRSRGAKDGAAVRGHSGRSLLAASFREKTDVFCERDPRFESRALHQRAQQIGSSRLLEARPYRMPTHGIVWLDVPNVTVDGIAVRPLPNAAARFCGPMFVRSAAVAAEISLSAVVGVPVTRTAT